MKPTACRNDGRAQTRRNLVGQAGSNSGFRKRENAACDIISGNVSNRLRRTVVVIPLSTSPQPAPPLLVRVRCDDEDVVAVTDQIPSIAKQRLDKRGKLSFEDLEASSKAFERSSNCSAEHVIRRLAATFYHLNLLDRRFPRFHRSAGGLD